MKIKRLDKEVIYKIRAGEVVEDPASCVKELIENSLDAKAKKIHIYVEDGGKRLIEVKDNGEGMDRDDLSLCVEPFTTSKINKAEDLKKVLSLGFRGEALSAIGKVSRLKIKSSSNSEFEGYEIFVVAGEKKHLKPCAHPKGTTVIVKDLFFSIPARRKFLKSSHQELRKIIEVVTRYALSNPEIEFILKTEKEEIFNLPEVKKFEDRIIQIFGEDYYKELIKIEESRKKFSFTVFVSKPEFLKENTTKIFFVNRRPFFDSTFSRAFSNIYTERTKSPDIFLFLFLSPEEIDVNIHPQKLQVKFNERLGFPWRIQRIIQTKIKEESITPKKVILLKTLKGEERESEIKQLEFGEMGSAGREEKIPVYEDLWQLENTYIIVKFEKGLLVIDQHTAHEKIIYEKIKKEKNFKTKFLSFPFLIKLKPDEFHTLKEVFKTLEETGFQIRILKQREIQIEGIPEFVKKLTKDNFMEIIESLRKERRLDPENVYKEIACKSAIQKGEMLTKEEMTNLIFDLFSLDDPFFCPHGRPVMIQITAEDLDRRFGR